MFGIENDPYSIKCIFISVKIKSIFIKTVKFEPRKERYCCLNIMPFSKINLYIIEYEESHLKK